MMSDKERMEKWNSWPSVLARGLITLVFSMTFLAIAKFYSEALAIGLLAMIVIGQSRAIRFTKLCVRRMLQVVTEEIDKAKLWEKK